MQLVRLALKNIRGSGFRSVAIFFAVMGAVGFLLATTLIITGAQYSLDSSLKRLGADLFVVPVGAETKIANALLMGKPTNVWMPRDNLQKIANITGVEAVSPQVYLSSMYNSPCCSVSEMFIVVFDPDTDFTLAPWLQKNVGRGLAKGEVIGGSYIYVPPGEEFIKIYGYNSTLKGKLEATGTGIDQTLFMTQETALAMAESSRSTALETLYVNPDRISTIMIKVSSGVNPHQVAVDIINNTVGVVPVESPNLFGNFRTQMNGLLWGFFTIAAIVLGLAMILIGIIFSMATYERRREMAVLRAVGATRSFIFRSVLTEACLLAVFGAIIGLGATAFAFYIFEDLLAETMKMPFLFPSIPALISLFGAGLGLAVITVTLAALIPAVKVSRQELAIAMRE
jgi:putative ABC transport system permease protein